MTRIHRKYTAEFKAEAVRMIADQGLSLAEVSRKLGIHPNLLRVWKNKAADNVGVPTPAQPPPSKPRMRDSGTRTNGSAWNGTF